MARGGSGTPLVGLIACEFCDQLHRVRSLARGEKALCVRCGGRLYGSGRDSLERSLALNVAALMLFVVANGALFLHVSLEGQAQANRIYSGVGDLVHFQFWALGLLIFLTTLLAPLLKILVTLYAIVAAMWRKHFPGVALAMRMSESLTVWSMLDVYLLAVIVAVVKLSMMATVQLEMGSYAFFALILVLSAANSALEPEEVWSRLRRVS